MPTPEPLQRLPGAGHPRAALAALVAVALLLGLWGAWRAFAPSPANAGEQLRQQARRIEALEQRNATLARSDQITRQANADLQATLAERDEEIAALRADVAFYERLVGATGQRRGLSVHEAVFAPEAAGTWRYTLTLTQNLNRGAISKGEARVSVEGVSGGRLQTLRWEDLLQKPGAPGQPFSFRYFQQLEGSIMLPEGFTPQRVRVQLRADGSTVDQAFPWTASGPRGD